MDLAPLLQAVGRRAARLPDVSLPPPRPLVLEPEGADSRKVQSHSSPSGTRCTSHSYVCPGEKVAPPYANRVFGILKKKSHDFSQLQARRTHFQPSNEAMDTMPRRSRHIAVLHQHFAPKYYQTGHALTTLAHGNTRLPIS